MLDGPWKNWVRWNSVCAGYFELFILFFFTLKDSEDNPQTLLFSATCPYWVFNVAKKYMKSTYEQVDLIGKKTQKTAITVEVNDSFSCWH